MAAALVNPPLLGPLSHNYASLVVCLDLLWCIWVRIYTREWGPRGQDRNLESPRKSTLDFREANLENRPQVDTSFSRPVWPQFCFYPLRGITQRTQSDGRWLRSGFVEVGNR